ncbi:DNA-deoxyinosine glycosylase [Sphingomonas sp.]|uniref:DNA-deoxyinosine glycosylase n=1 Tax=Sphingomonas sp. TaxID=28214 RepID=UPI0035BC17B5
MDVKSSFSPVAAPDARLLIVGSLPGERSLTEQRYYAHPQNQFWRLLSPVVGRPLATLSYDTRLRVLQGRRIALWDVVATARRRGSADAAIRDAETNDLAALVRTLPDLRAVAFNGGLAAKIGRPLLGDEHVALVDLPSSSPLHTVGLPAKQPAWSALADYLA